MRNLFEEGQPVCKVLTMREIWVRVHEIRHDIGKSYSCQDHPIVLGVLNGSLEDFRPAG